MFDLTCGASQPVASISVAAAARGGAEGAAQPAADLHGAVRDVVAEILELGRMPQRKRAPKMTYKC